MNLYNLYRKEKQVKILDDSFHYYNLPLFRSSEEIAKWLNENKVPYEWVDEKYYVLTKRVKRSIDAFITKQNITIDNEKYFIEACKQPELDELYNIFNNFSVNVKDTFYFHSITLHCSFCDEKVRNYTITEHKDDDDLTYTLITSYCFYCGKVKQKRSIRKDVNRLQEIFTNAMGKKEILIRQRGGIRLTQEQMLEQVHPIQDQEENTYTRIDTWYGSALQDIRPRSFFQRIQETLSNRE